MTRFIFGRLTGLLVTLFLASIVVFASLYLAPGGPEAVILGGRTPTPEMLEAARARYSLDDPLWLRYLHWAGGFITGDLGTSFVGGQEVAARIAAAAPTSITLITSAVLLILVLGAGLGLVAALSSPRIDRFIGVLSGLMAGTPSFVSSTIAIAVFAVLLGWFPAYGQPGEGLNGLRGFILPAICLALSAAPLLLRVTRQSVHDELHREYVLTARVRGESPTNVVMRHVLPNAAAPILTAAGLVIAALLAASVVVEYAFGLQGIGSLLVSAVNQKDFPTVQALTMLLVTIFVATNALIDIYVQATDPKVRGAA